MNNYSPQMDSYSAAERRLIGPLRRLGFLALSPLIKLLAALGISPNAVSATQVVLGVAVVLTVRDQPRLAFLLFVLALLLDVADGALARYTGKTSRFGMVVDQYSDHAREVLVIAALAYAGGLSPLLAALYGFIYTATNLTILLCNYFRAPLPIAFKTYLVTYPAIFFYLWFGWNWLDLGVAISLLLMSVAILQGLAHLRSALTPTAS